MYKENDRRPLPDHGEILQRTHDQLIDVEAGRIGTVALTTSAGVVDVTRENLNATRSDLRKAWRKSYPGLFIRNPKKAS